MGEGKHLRCTVELGGFRCRAVGFGMGGDAEALRSRAGSTSPSGSSATSGTARSRRRWSLRGVVAPPVGLPAPPTTRRGRRPRPGRARVIDERGHGVQITTIARLAAGGEDGAGAGRRRRAGARRCWRAPLAPVPVRQRRHHPRRLRPGSRDRRSGRRFARVVALDPPAEPAQGRAAGRARLDHGAVHLVWGAAEIAFARSVAESREPLREALKEVWRAARDGARADAAARDGRALPRGAREVGLDPRATPPARSTSQQSPTYRAAPSAAPSPWPFWTSSRRQRSHVASGLAVDGRI